MASLYDTDDRIEWLLSHGKFEQALEAVTMNEDCKRHTVLDVGRIYLDNLLACEKYDEAGKLCLKVLGQNKKLWEEEVNDKLLFYYYYYYFPYYGFQATYSKVLRNMILRIFE